MKKKSIIIELDIFDSYMDALNEGFIPYDEDEMKTIENSVNRKVTPIYMNKKKRGSLTTNKINYD